MRALPVIVAALTLVAGAVELYHTQFAQNEIVSLPTSRISDPQVQEKGIVVLLSDADGWGSEEDRMSDALTADGAVVVGVDLPDYYAGLGEEDRDCLYLVSDIEELSRQIHRDRDMTTYRAPLVAGIGAGGSLALAIAAQTPFSTIGATLAVDPDPSIALSKILCTSAPKNQVDGGMRYGLTEGELPNDIDVVFTPEAAKAGREHVEDLKRIHPDIEVTADDEASEEALLAVSRSVMTAAEAAGSPLDLPIVPIEVAPRRNTMAIIYSGDGGWRDIDQKLAAYLKHEGIPVVGVDALRYFWNEKTPAQTATDLSRIIATYRQRWNVENVVLIGYSFGANILPATYRLLPKDDQEAVRLMSLLALSHQADFEIAVTGWLGYPGAGKHGDPVDDLRAIEPLKIQCVYGLEEEDTACPDLGKIPGVDIHPRKGGHHFDGDYRALNQLIVDRLSQLLSVM